MLLTHNTEFKGTDGNTERASLPPHPGCRLPSPETAISPLSEAFFQRCSPHVQVIMYTFSFLFLPRRCIFYTLFNTLSLHNITSCRCTIIYLPNLYSLSLVITSSATMNNLGRVTFDRCTGIAIFLVLLLCPPCPLPYNPSTGAEENWGHGAGRTGEQKAKGRQGDVQAV